MKKTQKIFWKAVNIAVRTLTYLAIILLFTFACAVESMGGKIVVGACIGWLGLMGLLFLLEKKFSV